jgi:dihydrofolate synthase/folylpolyglutamate synthase
MSDSSTVNSQNYRHALHWLYDRIDYERTRPVSQTPFRLERIERLLGHIGNPQLRIPAVHIAGTKGKGSTAAMIDSILRHAGIRTGLFTSPHLEKFEERMRVSGAMPSPEQLTALVRRLQRLLDTPEILEEDRHPTFFEAATLLAWMFFEDQQVQIAILETGLGGRLDCTNVCNPLVTIITSIGFDHMQILGNTLPLIAFEKAGIIKSGVPVVQGQLPAEADAVMADRAALLQSPRFICGHDFTWAEERPMEPGERTQHLRVITPRASFDNLEIPLLGSHQAHNASLAVMACELLQTAGWPQLTPTAITSGLRQTNWPLRFEVFDSQPAIILDAAHNPDSIAAVCRVLKQAEWKALESVLVFAVSADKDADSMLRLALPEFRHVVLTRFVANPRSVPPDTLLQNAQEFCRSLPSPPAIHLAEDPYAALQLAQRLAPKNGYILVTGSLFLAAEVRGLLRRPNAGS